MLTEIRHALRSLVKSPGFAAVAILTLALGIGSTSSIFTLLDQVSLRLLPVNDPERLVLLRWNGVWRGSNTGYAAWSYPWYEDLREQNGDVFEELFCRFGLPVSFGFSGETERIGAEFVSGNYFRALGVGAQLGRTISPDDDAVDDAAPVAFLSHTFWRDRFDSDPAILGKTIRLNGNPFEIIGVAQAGFRGIEFTFAPHVFVPTAMKKTLSTGFHLNTYHRENRRGRWINVFGRLKPGASIEQAEAALAPRFHAGLEYDLAQMSEVTDYFRERYLESRLEVLPGGQGRRHVRGQLDEPLWALMAMVGLLLLIACANIANLLMARAAGRSREMAIRLALGAGRGRLVRQLMVESLLLAVLGGGLGLLISFWTAGAVIRGLPEGMTDVGLSAEPDPRILGFTAAAAIVTALIFGLAPALQTSAVRLATTLKDQAGSIAGGNFGMRRTLAGAQIFLSLVLLVGAGLFLRTVDHLQTLHTGVDTRSTLVFGVDPLRNGYDQQRANVFLRDLQAELRALPGVDNAGVSLVRILDGDNWTNSVWVEGYEAAEGESMNPAYNSASPGYFESLGIPILEGRGFTEADVAGGHRVGIVNQRFAQQYFGDESPVGRNFGFYSRERNPIEIVGVIPNVRYENMIDEIPRQVFTPYAQNPWPSGAHVFVRTSQPPEEIFAQVRQKVRELDASIPVYQMRTMKAQLEKTLVTERLIAFLAAAFGALATAIAAIGLYGLLSYSVTTRTREIGLRIALGAQKRDIAWLIVSDVVKLFSVGAVLAVAASLGLARLIESQLHGVEPWDPLNLALATLVLGAVALASGYLPAFRASRTAPMKALRFE